MSLLFVVPTLGERPGYLERSLQSIVDQEQVGLDLVLVAPRGRGVEEMATRFGGRFVEDPRRNGLSGALNAGLASAPPGTRYFTWLGDDDLLTPGSLSATVTALDADPGSVVAYGWCDYIDAEDALVFRSRAGRLAKAVLRFGPNLIPQPGSLLRYDDVVAVGGLDESVRLAMDLDLFLQLRRRGRFVAIPKTLASFRWHADSATVGNEHASMEESDRLRMKYMSRPAARAYEYLRWPGRWALVAAKRRVDRNVAQQSARR